MDKRLELQLLRLAKQGLLANENLPRNVYIGDIRYLIRKGLVTPVTIPADRNGSNVKYELAPIGMSRLTQMEDTSCTKYPMLW